MISHGNGVRTVYAQASKLLVKKGETITQGQVIAKVGSTGMSSGPHLHFEVIINGRYVNPGIYV
ncbi:MAG: M23 family metallopeptidase [Clostridia bacterium]|nr:M23 family metallopeptidase [Clostridia bacterium]